MAKPLKIALATVVAVLVAGGSYWVAACPCDRTPGTYLVGTEADAPVSDWTFANTVQLCQIQISVGFLPHSINLNCMSTPDGDLYLSCSNCGTKRWSNAAVANGTARIRINGTVYPVTLTRVMDATELDLAWETRLDKLHSLDEPANPPVPLGSPRPDGWWTFRVESRA